MNFLFPLPADQRAIKLEGVLNGASSRIIGLAANYPITLTWEFNPYIEGLNQLARRLRSVDSAETRPRP